MIQNLRLKRFKNFQDAELKLGNLTLLVGTNASGKSNLRDAFRFLHGISRGYTLAEIIGEKWIEGGSQVWKGIRGGTREAAYHGSSTFSLETTLTPQVGGGTYKIEVEVGTNGKPPRVIRESLVGPPLMYFDSHDPEDPPEQGSDPRYLFVRLPRDKQNRKHGKRLQFISNQPVLTQIIAHEEATGEVISAAKRVRDALGSMRFLDLAPEAMRIPSLPGQDILGDRGENLSSVLQSICESPSSKTTILEWIRELTPLDVTDFEFVPDQTGKILMTLIESGGQKTSAYQRLRWNTSILSDDCCHAGC